MKINIENCEYEIDVNENINDSVTINIIVTDFEYKETDSIIEIIKEKDKKASVATPIPSSMKGAWRLRRYLKNILLDEHVIKILKQYDALSVIPLSFLR